MTNTDYYAWYVLCCIILGTDDIAPLRDVLLTPKWYESDLERIYLSLGVDE